MGSEDRKVAFERCRQAGSIAQRQAVSRGGSPQVPAARPSRPSGTSRSPGPLARRPTRPCRRLLTEPCVARTGPSTDGGDRLAKGCCEPQVLFSTRGDVLEPCVAAPTLPSRPRTSLRSLLAGERLRSVYQPVIDLETGQPVAYESLVRGPSGSRLESPAALFREAEREGLLSPLDLAAREAAVRGALAAGLPDDLALFINVEPSHPPDACARRADGDRRE